MEKSASKNVALRSGRVATIAITRSITEIAGDPWEMRPDETLYIEDVAITMLNPTSGKTETGTRIRALDAASPRDAEWLAKGAYGHLNNTGIYLSRPAYDILCDAYAQVSADAMYPEWQAHIDAVAAAKKSERIAEAQAIIAAADNEMRGGPLMSTAEINEWRRNYNNIHNEGGSGYIPHRTSIEDYNHAKSVLAQEAV